MVAGTTEFYGRPVYGVWRIAADGSYQKRTRARTELAADVSCGLGELSTKYPKYRCQFVANMGAYLSQFAPLIPNLGAVTFDGQQRDRAISRFCCEEFYSDKGKSLEIPKSPSGAAAMVFIVQYFRSLRSTPFSAIRNGIGKASRLRFVPSYALLL